MQAKKRKGHLEGKGKKRKGELGSKGQGTEQGGVDVGLWTPC